ncbi:MAG: hypothetical protein LBG65_01945 [Puniceicoccales bacterium]|jgi:hypothetical protein|nr:hypothetical protein [Puniceicoccales bacterium]
MVENKKTGPDKSKDSAVAAKNLMTGFEQASPRLFRKGPGKHASAIVLRPKMPESRPKSQKTHIPLP